MTAATARLVTITGAKSRLAPLARQMGVAVEMIGSHFHEPQPTVGVRVAAECPVQGGHILPDGRVSVSHMDGSNHFYAADALCNALRGWTSEKGAEIMAAESHHRCERIRAEMAVNRRIA